MTPYYEHDDIIIYHGDCRDILPELEPVDLVLTDPPYGIKRFQRPKPNLWFMKDKMAKLEWDIKPGKEILGLIVAHGEQSIIWGMNNLDLPTTEHFLVWDKFQALDNFASAEIAWTNIVLPAKVFRKPIHAHNCARSGRHPTEKPLSLMLWCIEFAKKSESIIDPFMGSGTTLVAAKELRRKAIGIEIEEKYCEIAAKRLAQEVLPFGTEVTTS